MQPAQNPPRSCRVHVPVGRRDIKIEARTASSTTLAVGRLMTRVTPIAHSEAPQRFAGMIFVLDDQHLAVRDGIVVFSLAHAELRKCYDVLIKPLPDSNAVQPER